MSDMQCINCNVRLRRLRRHSLSTESEALVSIIRIWTYPRDMTPEDCICHACWELASHQPSSDNTPRQFGHLHICVVCGRSVQRTDRRTVMVEGANEEERRMANIILQWIQPRELTSEHESCISCWQRARRTVRQQTTVQNDNIQVESTCGICGSIITTRRPSSSDDGQILQHILEMMENNQVPPRSELCAACWQQIQHRSDWRETTARHQHTYITLPNMRRAAETPRHCIFRECPNTERHIVPDHTRMDILKNFQFYVPRGARICTEHLNGAPFEDLYAASYSMDTFTPEYIEDMIFMLTEGQNKINYENIQNYPDHLVEYFIGITKSQHQDILDRTPRLKNTRRGSFALTAYLCKLRTGDSGDRLSCLFQVPRRTLETLINIARDILITDFVPQYLGFNHITREQVAAKNSYVAEGIFGEPDAPPHEKPAITIADATYIYTQKSSNYLFQKDTYSLHKYRNLVKPFIMCCCNGYIIDVCGPYSATTNDATIMQDLLNKEDFNNFYNENDIFIVDRGFRDSMDSLHDKGYLGFMPETKEEGHSQLTTLEGNRSRCVTITRWVVEAVNGRFKRDFKIFRHEYFNRACRHLMTDFKIAAALLNAFCTQFVDSINAEQFVNIIHERLFMTNSIAQLVSELNLNRCGSTYFNSIDCSTVSFPRLSMEDLVLFACGVYQIRQARSYVGEHFRYHGIYSLEVGTDRISGLEGINPMLLRARIKSRHSSRKTYFIFIVVERNMNGRAAITSYCCNCIVGLRTVGCCSHVMSIIWYLGFARHEGMTRPAPFLDEVILRIT